MAVKQTSIPTVLLKHYDISEYKDTIPVPAEEDFKAKWKYCAKQIVGSVKVTTNWWRHLVSLPE